MGWLDRLRGNKNSARQAKDRLQLVLVHDRTDLSPGQLGALKDELIEVISRYVDIEPQAVEIQLSQSGREQYLVANIPLRPTRRARR